MTIKMTDSFHCVIVLFEYGKQQFTEAPKWDDEQNTHTN